LRGWAKVSSLRRSYGAEADGQRTETENPAIAHLGATCGGATTRDSLRTCKARFLLNLGSNLEPMRTPVPDPRRRALPPSAQEPSVMPSRPVSRILALAAVALAVTTCTQDRDLTEPSGTRLYTTPTGLVTANPPQIFVGAGDIATCSGSGDEATADLLDNIPGTVYVLGDNVYPDGTDSEYANCYHPNWGRHKNRTKPSAGNHDYNTSGARGYYNYFGAAAGDPSKGYYSYDLGAWHIIVLNSNISKSASSPQVQWLNGDLAAHPNQCKLAYFHHPLYSSGGSGSGGLTYSGVRDIIDALYAGGTDVYLAGHRHFYERMKPMAPNGSYDPNGLKTFIVGSGGIGGGSVSNKHPLTEVANGDTRGVLKMYLYDDSYAWRFIPQAGKTFTDTGSVACHNAGSPPPPGGGISPSLSSVGASPTTIAASSGSVTSTITVTVKDENGDPVSGATVVLSSTGSNNTFTQPAATNASGTTTGTLSSSKAETKTITAEANGVALDAHPTVTVTAGTVSAGQSSVSASPTSILVGSGSATITVTVRDAFSNPISGAAVNLAASGGGNALTQPAGPTDASGVATGALSSTATGSKTVSATAGGVAITQTATVQVSEQPPPSPLGHTLLTVGYNTSNSGAYTTDVISPAPNALITVAVIGHRSSGATDPPTITGGGMAQWDVVATATLDNASNPRKRITVFRAMSAAPGSGPLTIDFPATQSNSQWIVSQWTGVATGGVNGAGAIGQTGTVNGDAVNGLTVDLGSFSSPTNLAYGVFGVESSDPAITPGTGFTLIAEQPSNEGTKSDLMAEVASNDPTVDASWSGLDGAGVAIEIKATAGGNLPPTAGFTPSCVDRTCTFTSTSNDPDGSIVGTSWNFGDGQSGSGSPAMHTYASDATYTVELTVTDNGGASSSTSQSVSVAQRVPTSLAFFVQPTNTQAGATITPAVQVEVRDQFANRLTTATNSITVGIGTNPASGTLSGTKMVAAASGVATFSTLSIDNIGTGYTLTAAATGLTGATSASFNVTAAAPSPSLSTVSASPTTITAGGSGATITVTARDGSGNLLSGATVTPAASGSGNTLTPSSATTSALGVATFTLTSTGAGSKTVSATIDGVAITQTAIVTVNAGAISGTVSTLAASPGTITVNSGTATLTATVTDGFGNPVVGATVTFSATGTGNTLSGPALSNTSGVATGTLSSSVAENKTVSATASGTPLTQTASVQVTSQPPPAALAHTLLTQGYATANGKVYTTASIAPAANALITVAVLGHRAYGANAPPVVTGGGMSAWDVVQTVVFDPASGGLKRATIYRAMSAAPGSGPLTITFESSVSNAQWIVSQWTGVETSGSNGSGAIGQLGADAVDNSNGLTVNLAAFANPANVAYGVFGVGSNQADITPGAGFTLIAQQPSMEGTSGDLLAEWAVNSPAVSAVWSGLNGGGMGVEIRAATGP